MSAIEFYLFCRVINVVLAALIVLMSLLAFDWHHSSRMAKFNRIGVMLLLVGLAVGSVQMTIVSAPELIGTLFITVGLLWLFGLSVVTVGMWSHRTRRPKTLSNLLGWVRARTRRNEL